jgi:SM-20-related protein
MTLQTISRHVRPRPVAVPPARAPDPIFDLDALDAAPLQREPYDWLLVPGFVRPAALAAINADYPAIAGPSAVAVEGRVGGPAVAALLERLRSDDLARRISAKFGLDVAGLPRTVSVRRFAEPSDGAVHTDSKTKVVTVLLYLNETWTQPGGRLRVLRSGAGLDDYAAEVEPAGGALFAFRRAENSWHGFAPCAGERRSVQMQYALPKRAERGPVHKASLRKRLKRLLRRFG